VAISRFYVFFRRYRLIPPIKTLPAEEPGKYGVKRKPVMFRWSTRGKRFAA